MKKYLTTTFSLLLSALLLSGCGTPQNIIESDGTSRDTAVETSKVTSSKETQKDTPAETEKVPEDVKEPEAIGDIFTDRDLRSDYSEVDAIKITLNGNKITASDKSVKISDTTVTLTADKTHIISGQLDDGMIIVDAPDTAKLQIVFDGASITSATSAALYIKEADKVFITLKGENSLSNNGIFTAIDENDIDAAVFSKQDVTFNGTGTLNVNSPAGHGIVGKDDVVFTDGAYKIASSSHGIDANDSVRIKNASFTIDAGKDGIHVENKSETDKGFFYIESGSINVECEGDGISSSYYTQIDGGSITILAGGGYENGSKASSDNWGGFGGGFGGWGGGFGGGGKPRATSSTSSSEGSSSMKGFKSGGSLLVSNGTINVNSADDSIHSNLSVIINGGTFEIASGDDALHAEESLTVNDGKINITNSYEGLEALHIYVKGGQISLKSTDDGLNAAGGTDQSGGGGRDNMFGGWGGGFGGNSNGSIQISDGTLYIEASGDGIDANGTLEITGGQTTVCGPTSGDTAVLDYDKTGVISGGTFIGTGSSMMAQSLSSNVQGVIAISTGNQSAGTKITISDKNGNEIIAITPCLPYQILVVSSPELVSGDAYKITIGAKTSDITAK